MIAATSERFAMWVLGVICGVIATMVVYTVWATLQEVRYGVRKRQIERRYRPQPKVKFRPHPDPLIRARSHHADHR